MKTWNIGNTTVRNPQRLREALQLFRARMGGRPFRKAEQIEFQGAMIDAGLVDSTRYGGDDGGRKFASAFKQLGFITDWSKGQLWQMTLTSGSRQFAAEGEPVTRHVFTAIENSGDKAVYGLFITKKLDPNTADAFHYARYWRNRRDYVPTPIVALEIEQIIALVKHMQQQPISSADIRILLDKILKLQDVYPHGPAWYEAYCKLYEQWANSDH